MALSDQLAKLAARAKQAEERAAAAQEKARTDLESDVSAARASAEAQGEKLRDTAAAVEDAEYAVLQAALARMHAEALEAGATA